MFCERCHATFRVQAVTGGSGFRTFRHFQVIHDFMSKVDGDGFVLVTRRGKRRNGKRNSIENAAMPGLTLEGPRRDPNKIDPEHLLRTLDKAVVEVGDASFTRSVFSRLTDSLDILGSNGITEIVCYGLGRLSHRSSRYQLALLLCLRARYEPARVHVYDPLFRPEEVQVLRTLGLHVIETNEEGKRVIARNRKTLVFMPHCPHHLINNLLYANWGEGLNGCILLANSISEFVDGCYFREELNMMGYMLRIRPYVTEIRLENSFEYEEVFNCLNIHIFTRQELLKVPEDFWSYKEEPQYRFRDVDFVTPEQYRQMILEELIWRQ